jgi:sugar/nucleoside kinase (ribokinase family)
MSDARGYDLLVVGELNADILLTGDVTPEFGQVEKLVDDLAIHAGSSAAILAAGAARLGLRVLFSSRVGDDLLGHFLIDALREVGLEPSHVTVDHGIKTGATLLLSRGRDRAMLTYPGSIAAVGPGDYRCEWLNDCRHLHLASPFLLTRLRPYMSELAQAARAAGLSVSLDTNWDPSGRWELEDLWPHVDVFLPNEAELCAVTHCTSLDEALERMGTRVPVVVAKRGPAGAVARRGDEYAEVPAYDVPVHDTTGAGDTFDAGFLAAWLRGLSLRECLAVGSVCGSLTTSQPGGFNGQPTWDEAYPLAREMLRGL